MSKVATYTTIVHDTRIASGLSVMEFYVADIISRLSRPTCTMKRSELAYLCGLSERGLRDVIGRLVEAGYVKKVTTGLKSTSDWRELVEVQPAETAARTGRNFPSKRQKVPVEPAETAALYNYININNDKDEVPTEPPTVSSEQNPLPHYFGKTSLQRIVSAYCILWYANYETEYAPDFGMIGKLYKPMLEKYSEIQIASLFIVHFNWHGANGDDDFTFKRLESHMFPIAWVPKNVNEYGTYLKNVVEVDFESPEAIRAYVKENLGPALKLALEKKLLTIEPAQS